ncbi:MAG: NUDIX domain-containing protein [Arcanobacterium sp.]|nr:NUDIX domain-containing protein [Arcanobacterium sp.]MDY5589785.1 NUDIX domain-containing protein [Arcanobacterium sp.]
MPNVRDIERDVIAAEWPLDADGVPHRQAARVVVINPEGAIYLILGHDVDDTDYRWWFTPGGGIVAGESPREGAARELREETGLRVNPERFEGPVLQRHATFRFVGSTRRQDEEFFVLRVSAAEVAALDSADGRELTALEEKVLDDRAWWTAAQLEELQQRGENVFPRELAHLLGTWIRGWDGTVIRLTEA